MALEENPVATSASEHRVVAPLLHHVNLKTTRLDEMVRWYQTVCGMRINYESPAGAFMSNDAANHRVALLSLPGFEADAERRTHDGLHHLAFEYESLDDLDASYRRLRDEEIVPRLCVDHRMTISYYYEDPDGNLVELQCDVFGDWAASTEWMRTSLYEITEYPLGTVIDPALVSEDVARGLTIDAIRERADQGAYRWDGDTDFRLPPLPPGAPDLFRI